MKSIQFAALLLLPACQVLGPNNAKDSSRPNRAFTFIYNAQLSDVGADSKEVRLWIPVPMDTHDQEITELHAVGKVGNHPFSLGHDAFDRVSFVLEAGPATLSLQPIEHGQGRTLCVETKGEPIDLELSFNVRRYETSPHKRSGIQAASYRGDSKLIPLGGKVGSIAKSLNTDPDPMLAARQLYDHTLDRMRYDKPVGGGWGQGDAEWACDSRHGNCTDFHSYFMGLARSKNIPARFEMGFPISPDGDRDAEVSGYHCWAYFWVDDTGWVPVDISEADKHPEKTEYFFGRIDENRVSMSGGRELLLNPRPAAGSLNFLVYPYAEVDGQTSSKVVKSFRRIMLP